MSLALFRIAKGLDDGLKYYLSGSTAPGGDSAEQDAAPIGSSYSNVTNGDVYTKTSIANNSTADWTKLGDATGLSGLQTEIDALETSLGALVGSDGVFSDTALDSGTYLDSVTDLTGALLALDSAANDIQTEVNAIETGAGLNSDGTYTANTTGTTYIDDATSLADADYQLDVAVKVAYDLADGAVAKSGDTMTGNLVISTGAHVSIADAPASGTHATNKNYVDSLVAGLKWKNSVLAATTSTDGDINLVSFTGTIDGETLVDGGRYLIKNQTSTSSNGIYTWATGGTFTRAVDFDALVPIDEINGAAVYVENGTDQADSGWTVTSTVSTLDSDPINWTQFNGASGITAGIGLEKTGNVLNVRLGAGIQELPTDEIGVDILSDGALFLTVDGSTDSTDTAAQLSVKLDGTTLSRGTDGLKVSTTTIQTITDAQTEIDAIETASGGIFDTDGTFAAAVFSAFTQVTAPTSLLNALSQIDSSSGNLQTEVNALETSLGAVVDGSGVYQAFSGTNYIDGNASITADLTDLDAAIKAVADASGGTVTDGNFILAANSLSANVQALDTELGANVVDGTYILAANKINANITALDTAAGNIQTEVNALETSLGAVVDGSGVYQAFSGTNYIDGNTSITADLTDLDSAVKAVADAAGGAVTDGNFILAANSLSANVQALDTELGANVTDGNFILAASNINANIQALDTEIGANVVDGNYILAANKINANITALDTAIDAVSGSLGAAVTDGNFILAANSLSANVQALDTELGANVVDGNYILAANNINANITALDTAVDGVSDEVGYINTFIGKTAGNNDTDYTGTTYVADGDSLLESIQKLDIALKAGFDGMVTSAGVWDVSTVFATTNNLAAATDIADALIILDSALASSIVAATATNVTTATVVDSVLVDDVAAAKWLVSAYLVGTPTRKQSMEVFAVHDGTASADATSADHTEYAKLRIGTAIPGFNVDVNVSGSGAAQVMNLTVSATNAVNVSVSRLKVAAV
jgi:hypothetical protein